MNVKNAIKLLWYYIETRYAKLLHVLGISRNTSIIPKGVYCYARDEKNSNKWHFDNGIYPIKVCKYYRSTSKNGGIACTYKGFFGFDPCLYDQCKICGKNDELDKNDLFL